MFRTPANPYRSDLIPAPLTPEQIKHNEIREDLWNFKQTLELSEKVVDLVDSGIIDIDEARTILGIKEGLALLKELNQ